MRINDVAGLMISVISDWKGIIINPQPNRYGRSISWTRQPKMLDEPILASDVLNLIENRQYTFQVAEDKKVTGIIQIHYLYNRSENDIESASLAFYGTKPLIKRSQKIEDEVQDESEIAEFQTIDSGNVGDEPVSWLRIDYAPDDVSDIIHHECHMHLSGFPDTRFVVCGIPNPKQFVEFVMASFYPEIYRQHRLDPKRGYKVITNLAPLVSVNSVCVTLQDNALYAQVAHFRIPFK